MILATHALAGAVIGKNISSPWIIIVLSIAFHYIFDSIHHGEYVAKQHNMRALEKTWWKVSLDLLTGLAIIFSLIYFQHLDFITTRNIVIGMFFSMFPDFLTLIHWKLKWKFLEKLYQFHKWCHRLPRNDPERQWNFKNETIEIFIFFSLLIIFLI